MSQRILYFFFVLFLVGVPAVLQSLPFAYNRLHEPHPIIYFFLGIVQFVALLIMSLGLFATFLLLLLERISPKLEDWIEDEKMKGEPPDWR
jgi:hypothetical protein